MGIVLYHAPRSAPCRAVRLLAKTLGVELDLKWIQTQKGEAKTPEFLKMNPQHCIPVMDDNGFRLWESRTIMEYMCDKYGKNDSLYPKDIRKRALVSQRLYYDLGVLTARYRGYYIPVIYTGKYGDPALLEKIADAFDILDKFLQGSSWVAGENITIADYSIVAVVSNYDVLGFDVHKWNNVSNWYKRAQEAIPGYDEINGAGCKSLKDLFEECKK